jgi:hypothetical protein
LLANASISPKFTATNKRGIAICQATVPKQIFATTNRGDSQLLWNSFVSTIPRQRTNELFKNLFNIELAARLYKRGYRQFISVQSTSQSSVQFTPAHDKECRVQKIQSLVYVL